MAPYRQHWRQQSTSSSNPPGPCVAESGHFSRAAIALALSFDTWRILSQEPSASPTRRSVEADGSADQRFPARAGPLAAARETGWRRAARLEFSGATHHLLQDENPRGPAEAPAAFLARHTIATAD